MLDNALLFAICLLAVIFCHIFRVFSEFCQQIQSFVFAVMSLFSLFSKTYGNIFAAHFARAGLSMLEVYEQIKLLEFREPSHVWKFMQMLRILIKSCVPFIFSRRSIGWLELNLLSLDYFELIFVYKRKRRGLFPDNVWLILWKIF